MADDQNVSTEEQVPAGGEPPVIDESVKVEDADASQEDTPKVPESIPYDRFKEVNEKGKRLEGEVSFLRDLLSKREQAPIVPQQFTQIQDAPAEPGPVLPSRPDPKLWMDGEGYEDPDKKMEVLADWRAECKFAEREYKQSQQKAQEEQRNLQNKAVTFFTEVNAEYPDFVELTRNGPRPTDDIMAFVLQTENSKKLAYFLAKNPQEIVKLNGLNPRDAAIAIGRLDAKVGAPAPETKQTTKAPAPIAPIIPSSPAMEVDISKLPLAEFIAARNKEEFGK